MNVETENESDFEDLDEPEFNVVQRYMNKAHMLVSKCVNNQGYTYMVCSNLLDKQSSACAPLTQFSLTWIPLVWSFYTNLRVE